MPQAGSHVCQDCGRKFSMAAHLARHRTSAHNSRGPTSGGSNGTSRAPSAFRAPAGGIANALSGLRTYRDQVRQQRDKLDQELRSIDRILSGAGFTGGAGAAPRRRGRPPGSGRRAMVPSAPPRKVEAQSASAAPARGRPRAGATGIRSGSLKSYAQQALSSSGRPMTVVQIGEAALRAGYATKNKTLGNSLSAALSEMVRDKQVVKVRRGTYRVA